MFTKELKDPVTPVAASGVKVDPDKMSAVPSTISPDLKIVGDLKSHGDIHIDGTIEGDINSRLLTIGEQARVEGSIVAETVRISGTVMGQVQAKSVHLDRNAKVTGDVSHETLTMEAGAFLEGQVRRMEGTAAGAKVASLRPATSGNGERPGYGGADSASSSAASPASPASPAP